MSNQQHALIILTSIDTLGNTDKPTGFFWEELAVPYWSLRDQGLKVELASTQGGEVPADPGSDDADDRPAAVQRFMDDNEAMNALHNSLKIDDVNAEKYVLVFLPGGHGTMWDLAQTNAVANIVGTSFDLGSVVGAVCHGPAGLTEAKLADGCYLVKGRKVNSFTNEEEQQSKLDDVVPYLLESRLKERGALFEKNDNNFDAHAVRDGMLVTGQNPASSQMVAKLMIEALTERNMSTITETA